MSIEWAVALCAARALVVALRGRNRGVGARGRKQAEPISALGG